MQAVLVVTATLLSAAAAQSCATGFTLVGSACIMIPDDELSWQQAKAYCRNLDLPNEQTASLARADTCDQLAALVQYIQDAGYPIVDYWLGGTTVLDPDGAFRWDSTGELIPMEAPFWFPGQPDLPIIERTLSLSKTGLFADENESLTQRFICQLL